MSDKGRHQAASTARSGKSERSQCTGDGHAGLQPRPSRVYNLFTECLKVVSQWSRAGVLGRGGCSCRRLPEG